MTEAPKTVWVTKYALSDGIRERELISEDGGYAYVKAPHAPPYGVQCTSKDYHTTREAAVSRAEQMRDAKLKSLEKQAEKLRKMVF